MKPLSVVIVCKNEAGIIGHTIQSVKNITDDIVCVDTGSTDATPQVIKENEAKLIETNWQGYGKTRNKALQWAKYDWILMLDADEPIDKTLEQSILNENFSDPKIAYKLSRFNFFAGKKMNYGEWGRNESHIRLFNRKTVRWEEVEVHEDVILQQDAVTKTLNGHIFHYTADNYADFIDKVFKYARLTARKYYKKGKKSNFIKIYFSPIFSFVFNYIFRLGFLDGRRGFLIARANALYTYLKYVKLRKMYRKIDS